MTLALIYNLSLLVALSVFSRFIHRRMRKQWQDSMLQGFLFGAVGVVAMANPVFYEPGVSFDSRSVVVSLCGLFFGPVAAAVTMLMTGAYRLMDGGIGVLTGVLTIISSGLLGSYFHEKWRMREREPSLAAFIGFGVLVHVVVVLLFFLIPGNAWDRIRQVGPVFLTVFPLATALVGKVLTNAEALERSMEALFRSREQYRTTLYSIGDAVITTDRKGRIREMNRLAETLTGWTEQEALGLPLESVFRIIHEYTREPAENPARRVMRGEQVVDLAGPSVLVARNGTERFIADSAAPIRDGEGAITGVVLVFRDQTEERAVQEVLRASEERYRTLFDSNPQPMWVYDRETLGFLEVNTEAVNRYGYSREEFLGLTILDIRPEADIPMVMAELELMKDNKARRSNIRSHRRKDGSLIRVEVVSHPMVYQGRSCQVALVNDVTERIEAEEAAMRQSERLRGFIDNSPLLIAELDAEGRYLLANAALAEFVGVSHEGLEGRRLGDILDDATLQIYLGRIRQVWESRAPMAFDEEVYLRGKTRLVNTLLFPLYDAMGNVTSVGGVSQDMTERREADREREVLTEQLRQAQKLEAVGRLAGGVAHDFNNMLGAMMGHAELALLSLEEDGDPKILREDLQEIIHTGKRSAELTRQLLAFARRQTIAPRTLSLGETVNSMLKMLKRLIGENITLAWEAEPGLWPVRMDPAQVDQILVNLVVNARDAISGTGTITISIGNMACDEGFCRGRTDLLPGEYAVLKVCDTGTGMDETTRSQLFEPFFTTKEQGKGTGLGLATVYGIVRQNGGHIEVESAEGKGTRICIYLPRHEEGSQPARGESGEVAQLGGTETILLVEDELAVLDLAQRILSQMGYQVIPANSPREALRIAAEYPDPIHLLVTDVVMPGMSGKQVCEELLKHRPGLKSLFVSGYTADVIAPKGILEEGIHFLQKPFTRGALAQKVRKALNS